MTALRIFTVAKHKKPLPAMQGKSGGAAGWGVVTAKSAENVEFLAFLAALKSDEGGSI
jgi:hypothetical protein